MLLWPNGKATIPHVTSEFGPRKAPLAGATTYHLGIDLVGFPNNCAPEDGVIVFAQYNGGGGNEIRVKGDASGIVHHMKHNSRFLAKLGQRVKAGDAVGIMGMTGNVTGIHCHYETHPGGGAAVNPRNFVRSGSIAPAGGGGTTIPIDPTEAGAQTMYLTDDTNKTTWLVTDNGRVALRHPTHIAYFTRLGVTRKDTFFDAEVAIMHNYIREAQGGTSNDVAGNVLKALSEAVSSLKADLHYIANETTNPASIINVLNAVRADQPDIKLSDEQIGKLTEKLKFPTMAELTKLENQSTSAILAAIAIVDENTLATFGLKRV
jgi:molybdopterin converting factor small subunit